MSSRKFSKKMNEWICFFWLEELLRSKVKRHSFVFFGESTAWKFAFEINWPLEPLEKLEMDQTYAIAQKMI